MQMKYLLKIIYNRSLKRQEPKRKKGVLKYKLYICIYKKFYFTLYHSFFFTFRCLGFWRWRSLGWSRL